MHTDSNNPSKSLIKRICYPENFKVITPSIRWGLEYETSALTEYHKQMKYKHSDFTSPKIGLVISPSYPQFGATPDSTAQCTCCERGVVEVKCPYRCKEKSYNEACLDS